MQTVLIAGGGGLIGLRLSAILKEKGYQVLHLSRQHRPNAAFPTYKWDVGQQWADPEAIKRTDYVVNLAGAGIADSPWTAARKKLIIDSRVDSARLLLSAFQEAGRRPKAYLSSAAIGYYGDRGEELLAEQDQPGQGFLSECCIAWERAGAEVAASGIRTVVFRTGIVLSRQGGALPRIMLPIHFRLGTYFGNGRQWYSWIHIDDLCDMFVKAMEETQMEGVYNGVAPNPVRNKAFVEQAITATGHSAMLVPAPAFALRLALGEMASTILSSTKASSRKIEEAGFSFRYPRLPEALENLLQREG